VKTRQDAVDVALLVALKVALGAWVLRGGFSHVSDDDYARVVIAQLFAHAPRLDPSGTSWLPFPFWTVGGLLMVTGRSLDTARLIAFCTGVVSVVPVYLALRKVGVVRWCAIASVIFAMATPWNAWLGVATVPEALTGALIACGAILMAAPDARPYAAIALLAAALSRYEAWPVCAVLAVVCMRAALREPAHRGRDAWCGALAVAGPASWMIWNAYAHDGPLHFLRRVAAFRSAAMPLGASASAFPRALVTGAPEIAIVAFAGMASLADPAMRRRWGLPLLSVAALVAFLVCGDLQGGAPTHHAERALVGAWWVLGAFGLDGTRSLLARGVWGRPKREAWVAGAAVAAALTWTFTIPSRFGVPPGTSASEDRTRQLARGAELATRGGWLDVTPCAYEHFALLAALGAPERARILPAVPGDAPDCPRVAVRDAPEP
jgi:hypothetical protein